MQSYASLLQKNISKRKYGYCFRCFCDGLEAETANRQVGIYLSSEGCARVDQDLQFPKFQQQHAELKVKNLIGFVVPAAYIYL